MTGVVASASAALAASKLGSAREDTVQRQRRGRAWRLLAAQSGMQVGAGAEARSPAGRRWALLGPPEEPSSNVLRPCTCQSSLQPHTHSHLHQLSAASYAPSSAHVDACPLLFPPACLPARLPARLPACLQVTVPGATDKGAMKLIDVLGRLLLLALRKRGSAARFCVAAGAVASLAGGRARAEGLGILVALRPCLQ